ncbi:MAG: VOC family protein [Candidatus Methanoperedens sp.]|nr:VOC family protein [Candidatus Methanoperedens sp.]
MFKRIDHIEIIPRNIEKTISFYTGILGFKIKQRQKVEVPPLEEIVYIELNGSVIELMKVKNPALPPQNPWQAGLRMIAIEVEDMDMVVKYLTSKGVEITWGPIILGKSKRAEIKDPDGLSIELRQW